MKARVRTSSRSRTRVDVGTRSVWRVTLGSLIAGSRSALRKVLSRSPRPEIAPRSAISTRSGAVAKLVSPSSDAKTAPPINAAPHSPVKIVPLNHCTESRRRSIRPPLPPSTSNGGSLPSSMASASNLRRWKSLAPRSLPWSKRSVPLHSRSQSKPVGPQRQNPALRSLNTPACGIRPENRAITRCIGGSGPSTTGQTKA